MKVSKRVSQVLTVSAVILVFILIVGIGANLAQISALNKKKARLINEIEYINNRIEAYKDEIEYKNSDWYIEQYARENLNMKRKGETLFR